MKQYTIAVVGATGMVGRKFLQVLEEKELPVKKYYLFASARSAGSTVRFMGQDYVVEELTPTCFDGKNVDIALFSAGGDTSKTYSPIAAAAGAVVIDNSSCWRMDPQVPLVVPEVNTDHIPQYKNKGIIANPNCSTIQAMVVLKPLLDKYGIKRVVYSTYQAVSGAGLQGYKDLEDGLKGAAPNKFPHPIAFNILPQIDVFLENGYTKEEQKLIGETRKILSSPDLAVTATAVRVPVYHGHSESVNVELNSPFELSDVRALFESSPGLIVQDDVKNSVYPMAITAEDKDEVFVGRIRRDFSVENGLNLWVVADNIRKGAATNAVQIAQELIRQWESA